MRLELASRSGGGAGGGVVCNLSIAMGMNSNNYGIEAFGGADHYTQAPIGILSHFDLDFDISNFDNSLRRNWAVSFGGRRWCQVVIGGGRPPRSTLLPPTPPGGSW